MTNLDFTGSTALITGAGGGLGREYALLLASRGARVIVNDLGGGVDGNGAGSSAAERVVEEIRTAGGTASANSDSVSTVDGAKAMIAQAVSDFGSIDILINNAGILRDRAFHKMEPADVDAVIDVHLRGSFYVTLEAWKIMREGSFGRIVNTSSNSGLIGNFGQANYGAAKMGIVGLTRVLAIEGARHNIHVNAIAPAAATRMTQNLISDELTSILDASRVAPVAAWLAHPSCDVNGEIISAGGGRVARYFVGLTQGYFDRDVSPEVVRDNWSSITDTTGAVVPITPAEELQILQRMLAS